MDKKLNLVQVTHDLAIGGLQQVVVNICHSLDRDRFNISVVCLRSLGEFTPDVEKVGINVHLIPKRTSGTDYFSFIKLAKYFKSNKVDVIHTHNTQPLVDGTIAALLSGVKTIVHTDHARDFPDKKRYMFAEWLMSHFVYKMVGVSPDTSNNLIKFENISPKKIRTIPNGIDGSRFNVDVDKESKKKELGLKNSGPVIGIGVRLSEQKGITYLLKAMPGVIRLFPDITLFIVGKGPLEEELKRESHALGIDKNVVFAGARLDIPQLLKILDIYVLPSLWEGLPIVLLEAMASGCPIIATNVGGNSTAITHGYNGSLIESKNSHALSDEIVRLLLNENIRDKYSENARFVFQNRFSASVMTKQYQELYLRDK